MSPTWFSGALVSLPLVLAAACRPSTDLSKSTTPRKLVLESGSVIRNVELTHDEQRGTLELEYMTDLRVLEDHEALQYEAEDIWAEFLEREATALNVSVVYLSPRDDTPPVIEISFRMSKVGPGKWAKEGGFAFPLKRNQSD